MQNWLVAKDRIED